MQVGIDVKCMHTNFSGRGLLSFGDIATFKNGQISPSDNGLYLIDWNRPKKFMQVGIDVKCMHTNFGGRGLSSFGDIATFKNGQISPSDNGLYLIDWNRPKKFMQVGIDVKCMHTNFGGRGLSSFGDIATFKNSQISLFDHGHIVHGHQKI